MTGTTVKKANKKPIPQKVINDYWMRSVYSAVSELGRAFHEGVKTKGLTQEILASRLQKNKSIISRILKGHNTNLTLKTLSEMSLAMEYDLQIKLVRKEDLIRRNYCYEIPDNNYARVSNSITTATTNIAHFREVRVA